MAMPIKDMLPATTRTVSPVAHRNDTTPAPVARAALTRPARTPRARQPRRCVSQLLRRSRPSARLVVRFTDARPLPARPHPALLCSAVNTALKDNCLIAGSSLIHELSLPQPNWRYIVLFLGMWSASYAALNVPCRRRLDEMHYGQDGCPRRPTFCV